MLIVLMGAGCAGRLITPTTDVLKTAETSKPVAYLRMENASATVTHGEETLPAEDGVGLQAGDQVVSIGGTVSIVYPETGVSALEPGTSVEILADDEGSGLFAQVRVLSGSVWTRLERLLEKDESFSVTGAGVVATVRGTAFGMTVENDVADIQVVDHAVEVSEDEPMDQMIANVRTRKRKISVSLPAGTAWRGTKDAMQQKDDKAARKMMRVMGPDEQRQDGYQFAMKRVPPEMMKAPGKFRKLPWKKAEKEQAMQDRLQTLRELRAVMMQQ